MEKIKIALAVLSGALAAWLGDVYALILLAIGAMVLDYITGVMAAGCEHDINSEKAARGVYKKAGFMALLFLGFFLDVAVAYFLNAGVALTLPFRLPFGLIICAWIVFTEAISILENLTRLGVNVPSFLLKFLKVAQNSADQAGGGDAGNRN